MPRGQRVPVGPGPARPGGVASSAPAPARRCGNSGRKRRGPPSLAAIPGLCLPSGEGEGGRIRELKLATGEQSRPGSRGQPRTRVAFRGPEVVCATKGTGNGDRAGKQPTPRRGRAGPRPAGRPGRGPPRALPWRPLLSTPRPWAAASPSPAVDLSLLCDQGHKTCSGSSVTDQETRPDSRGSVTCSGDATSQVRPLTCPCRAGVRAHPLSSGAAEA